MKRRVNDPRAWLHRERPVRGAGFDPRSRALIETRTVAAGTTDCAAPAANLGRGAARGQGGARRPTVDWDFLGQLVLSLIAAAPLSWRLWRKRKRDGDTY